jgi:hypothetical protein
LIASDLCGADASCEDGGSVARPFGGERVSTEMVGTEDIRVAEMRPSVLRPYDYICEHHRAFNAELLYGWSTEAPPMRCATTLRAFS